MVLKKLYKSQMTLTHLKTIHLKKYQGAIEVLYSGAKVLGTNTMLKWEMSENMTRPYADTTKVEMNYAIVCAKNV